MGCYTVPLVAAGIHYFMRKKNPSWMNNKHHKMLNLLFVGAAVFGVVDHAWNGELLAFSLADVALGAAITVALVVVASVLVVAEKYTAKQKSLA